MLKKLNDLYETHRVYVLNPCDAGAHAILRPGGRALARLAGLCPCCAGTRLVFAAGLAAVWPVPTLVALGAALAVMTAQETIKGEPNDTPAD
jgi:hypothetical protein